MNKIPVIVFFGYPSGIPTLGGLIWTKRVADYIDQRGIFEVKKISNYIEIDKTDVFFFVRYFRDALRGFIANPNVAVLDSYGEANIILWIFLRLFKRKAKVLMVCHHYEPRIYQFKNNLLLKKFQKVYDLLINKVTKAMLLNSDLIITPSLSSANQLNSILHQNILEKVVIAGVGINTFSLHNQKPKDIDFLCIGRIKKFEGLDIIWQLIRQQKPKASFVVCGHATVNDIDRLRPVGNRP